jgi:hypothetical protein
MDLEVGVGFFSSLLLFHRVLGIVHGQFHFLSTDS